MRGLSGALQALINGSHRRPAILVELGDTAERYTLYRDDSGTVAEYESAAIVAPDGSLLRAYCQSAGGAGAGSLYVQRITTPATGGQWVTWTLVSSGNVLWSAPPAFSVNPGNVIRLFWSDGPSVGAVVRYVESSDNGATWGAVQTAVSGANTVQYMASGGNDDLFYVVQVAVGDWRVRSTRRSGGVWSAPSEWSLGSFPSMGGIGAAWDGAAGLWRLVMAITSGGVAAGESVQALTYDGTTWGSLAPVVPLDANNLGLQYRECALRQFDGQWRLAYIEYDDGSVDGVSHSWARIAASPDFVHWELKAPLGPTAVLSSPTWLSAFGYYWVLNGAKVYRWKVFVEGDVARVTDVSSAVLAYRRHEASGHGGGVELGRGQGGESTVSLPVGGAGDLSEATIELVIDNRGGQYNALPGLVRNGRVRVQEGYVDGNGVQQMVEVGRYRIERWGYRRGPGENELVVYARDAWLWLDREATQQWAYTNRTLGWLLAEVSVKAGLGLPSVGATAQFSQVVPSFVVLEGETWGLALHRLLGLYGCVGRVSATGQLVVLELQPGDASVWAYQHEIERAQWAYEISPANHARVFGKPGLADAWDWNSVQETGLELLAHTVDRMLASNAQCGIAAGLAINRAGRKTLSGGVVVPVNPGLEVFDVVTIKDSAGPGGLPGGQGYRIWGQTVAFHAEKGEFAQAVEVGGV